MLGDVSSPSQLAVELFQPDASPVPTVVPVQQGSPDVLHEASTGGFVRHVRIDDAPCGTALTVVASAQDPSGNIATAASRLQLTTPDILRPTFVENTPTLESVTWHSDVLEPKGAAPPAANATVMIQVQASEPAVVACVIEACNAPSAPISPGAMGSGEGAGSDGAGPLSCNAAAPSVGRILREVMDGEASAKSVSLRTVAAGMVAVKLPELAGRLELQGHLVRTHCPCHNLTQPGPVAMASDVHIL